MPPELDHEEDYLSEEDSDFAPDDAQDGNLSASEDESPVRNKPAAGKPKRQPGDAAEADDAGFDNSGDEGIIEKSKKRRKKARGKDEAGSIGDAGEDEGILIKTRSMRATEKAERRAAAANGPVTIDVDALWAQMVSGAPAPSAAEDGPREDASHHPGHLGPDVSGPQASNLAPSETIRIKRTYNFAGKVHTEEKLVARDSAEAKLYLASLGEDASIDASADLGSAPKRIPRKAFRSAFEPITDSGAQRTDLNLGMTARLQLREQADKERAKKLNTVEKSRMDWAGYVDKEGIKDELELASKSKASYTARQDFLARSEAVREEDARRARQSTKV